MPPKKHKGKGPASASVASSMFAIDYASDLGKVAQMPGSFWGMKFRHRLGPKTLSALVVVGHHLRRHGDAYIYYTHTHTHACAYERVRLLWCVS